MTSPCNPLLGTIGYEKRFPHDETTLKQGHFIISKFCSYTGNYLSG
jgi:hypothetical protein